MTPIRTAVVGVGYLGRFHAQKYAASEDAQLVAVVDPDQGRRTSVAEEVGAEALESHDDLPGRVDAVSIVAPTRSHYAIARDLLDAGVHVLVEKPITVTAEEAGELVDLAAERNLVLQVGHLERFNAAILGVAPLLSEPRFIESHRLAPFNPRGADVSVVLDLMIHDVDLRHGQDPDSALSGLLKSLELVPVGLAAMGHRMRAAGAVLPRDIRPLDVQPNDSSGDVGRRITRRHEGLQRVRLDLKALGGQRGKAPRYAE